MYKDLDNRTQLALALMATEKVYLNWVHTYLQGASSGGAKDTPKWSLHLFPQELNFYLWRKGSTCAHVGILMVPNSQGYCHISVENYFRGKARDTLDLNKPSASFEDYLTLANNFPEPSVELILQGLSEGFKAHGKINEYNYYLGVAATFLDLKD